SVRMFLAVPLLLGLALYWINPQLKNLTTWNWAIIVLVLFIGIRKISTYSSCIDKQTETTNFGPIAIKNLDELTQKCDELKELTKTYNVDLVVFIADWRYGVAEIGHYNYACPVLQENTMNTVMNVYERRTWIFNNEKNKVRKNLLLYNPNLKNIEEIKQKMDCTIIQKSPHLLLIENNDKTLMELSKTFDFPYKRHTY
ncbi:hypothetical protein, partial [Lishizhenia sp.]|uniref:hypothetical protein n=1 Tax=Lishizhenia sp. TaxID=2497594 RepID=UPI00299F47F7